MKYKSEALVFPSRGANTGSIPRSLLRDCASKASSDNTSGLAPRNLYYHPSAQTSFAIVKDNGLTRRSDVRFLKRHDKIVSRAINGRFERYFAISRLHMYFLRHSRLAGDPINVRKNNLPTCRVIYVRRNPYDVILSGNFNNIIGPFLPVFGGNGKSMPLSCRIQSGSFMLTYNYPIPI